MMNPLKLKLTAFEYMLDCLSEWCIEMGGSPDKDIDLLKAIKLNFFTVAVSTNRDDKGLLKLFDSFYALPYGHVETEIYANRSSLSKYELGRTGFSIKNKESNLDTDWSESIRKAVYDLKGENQDLVMLDSFELVELSHEWKSWTIMYNLARYKGKRSIAIPDDLIMKEDKHYTI